MTQIRVHELASELDVSTQQVLSFVEQLGRKVRGPSTVIGVSVAAKVRGRFRAHRPGSVAGPASAPAAEVERRRPEIALAAVSSVPSVSPPAAVLPSAAVSPMVAGAVGTSPVASSVASSLFLTPVAPNARPATAGSTDVFADPFAVPVAPADRLSATSRPALPVVAAAPAPGVEAIAAQDDHGAAWERRGFDAPERDAWISAGLRLTEADLADRCRSADITPAELSMKLSGRTTVQRLRDGEASTSVWARIRETEQQPRRSGTKLTGRFS